MLRTPLIAVLASVALAVPAQASALATPDGPAAPADAVAPRAEGALRIGTFNINAAQKFKIWRNAVAKFRGHVQVAGLQEVNNDRKLHYLGDSRWGAYWPEKLRQNPVTWDKQVFDLVAASGPKIATARHVGHEKPGTPSYRKASRATVVRLTHIATGKTISVINVHLVPGGVNGGRKIRENPRLFKLYVDQVRGLASVVSVEQTWAEGRVFVLGDFNVNYPEDKTLHHANLPYARLTKAGLVSAWESRDEIEHGHGSGTRGGAYLDNVWSSAAQRISVLRRINVSDHYPVTVTYPAPA